ncbi:hypothetical protein J1N35_001732 [Gossypium stocksii]|uniref:Uncharacterized protein n=1 Tax=Gossypium stocksii TaxID=47602 RepID=A0A9D4AMQ2_9ROSI|nr:hypothetical protein J1N35_001732 [Gossypium stocksii]
MAANHESHLHLHYSNLIPKPTNRPSQPTSSESQATRSSTGTTTLLPIRAGEKWMRMRGKYEEYEVVFLFLRLDKIAVGRMLIFPNVKVILLQDLYNHFEIKLVDFEVRWNRPEDLLIEGRKDRDFSAKDTLQPVLKLFLGPDSEELRNLTIKEAFRVIEAIVLGSVADT